MARQKKDETGKLVLAGALIMRAADEIHEKLTEALAQHSTLEIDCHEADEVDLSFIQLVLAARASATRSARSLALAQPASGALHAALERGGFLPAGAGAVTEDQAFWLKSETI